MKLAQSERLDDEMSLLLNCFSMNGEEEEKIKKMVRLNVMVRQ